VEPQWAKWLIWREAAAYFSSIRARAGGTPRSSSRRRGNAESPRTSLGPKTISARLRARPTGRSAALGVAGGDGSLGAVAQLAIERDVPFVCVPFGTRNHFARDIGLDRRDPIAALDAFGSARERRIDIGRVGDRVFLNNVSVGLYAQLVQRREAHRRRRVAFARARALWLSLQDGDPRSFVLDGERIDARVVLIANNAYELDVLELGARTRLDEGRLYAYVAEDWLPHTWNERAGERFTLGGPGSLSVAIDGEPAELDSPVELAIEPRALRILLP
jgi:diacylglycerol kinase family enzyme